MLCLVITAYRQLIRFKDDQFRHFYHRYVVVFNYYINHIHVDV